MLDLILLIVGFAILNRFSGGGLFWQAHYRGRPIYYTGIIAIILLGNIYGPPGTLTGFSFLLWRLPGWYASLDMGRIGHTKLRDFLVMSVRGLVAFPIFTVMGEWGLLALLSLGIAFLYDFFERVIPEPHDHIRPTEWSVGALWGSIAWLLLV